MIYMALYPNYFQQLYGLYQTISHKTRMKKRNIEFQNVQTVGTVKFGEGCVIHPTCSIIAEGGEILIGSHNIIQERVIIYNKPVKDAEGRVIQKPMVIGDYNLFEVCTRIENSEIGNLNLFECRSTVQDSKIGEGCAVGSDVVVSKKVIPNHQRLFYPSKQRTNELFNEERHKEIISDLYDALLEIAPKPKS